MTCAVLIHQTPGSTSSMVTVLPAYCFPREICPLAPIVLTSLRMSTLWHNGTNAPERASLACAGHGGLHYWRLAKRWAASVPGKGRPGGLRYDAILRGGRLSGRGVLRGRRGGLARTAA